MIKHSVPIFTLAVSLCVVVGCPTILSRSSDTKMETRERVTVDASAGAGGVNEGAAGLGQVGLSGSEAVELMQLDEPLQPAPSEETLCMLRVGQTLLADAKKILGKPRSESQSNDGATLTYLYTEGKSLFLSFANAPTQLGGLVPTGYEYVFAQAEVNRMSYPACWRRVL